ncbi:DNA-dependent protein kinase catalytic subunit-like, partial [Uloborus diversus]|uniref:DNA-dependent protein kinase catalytic subunit-like n=1 Tax=Uloborus diversus TaxID=327109 RepID=UPI002408F605
NHILIYFQIKAIKLECFTFLDDIIDLSGCHVQEYGSQIEEVCIFYLKRDVGADVKKASLVTLSKVLETCRGYQGEKKINVKQLMEDLFFQLSLGSKLTAKVKEEVLCVIGIIAHYYPEEFINYQERVLSVFLQELKIQMNAKVKAPIYSTVAGCLFGLKEYLYNFPVLYSEETEKSFFIFDIARKIIRDVDVFSVKTTSVCRASLQLLAAHASQFGLFIFENSTEIYDELMQWVIYKNRDMQKLGRDATVALLKVIAEMITSKYSEDEKFCRNIFSYFMKKFLNIFVKNASSKELHIAVIGYGLLAGVCKLCLNENEVKRMLQKIIQKSEHEFFSDSEDLDDKIMVLPSYIEALSSIITEIAFVPENVRLSLVKLVLFQIDKFPKIPSAYSFIAPKAVIRILLSVKPKGEIFEDFLSEIVTQGIVKTCSHPVVVEAEALKESSKEGKNEFESTLNVTTYKDYIYLWKNILNVVQLKELSAIGVAVEERQHLMECIYDEILKSSLSIISKLDLTLQRNKRADEAFDEEIDISSDPLNGMYPSNITDYYIFINIVDFLRDLLTENCMELFSKWVYPFGREMIFYITKHPYHSGFYKLLSLALSICVEIGYFNVISSSNSSFTENIKSDNLTYRSFQLFSKAIKEIVVKQQQFKDDLLASCLQVLLVLPIEIVTKEIDILIPALENALKLGMSYLPLAKNAVCALQKWSDHVPLSIMEKHFPRLLPHLNKYLLMSNSQGNSSVPFVKEIKQSSKKTHKISAKLGRQSRQTHLDSIVDDPALLKIQLQIITYLGKLGKYNKMLFEKATEDVNDVAIAWDPLYRNHLKYSVPFVDVKLDIYFDDFLPRILEIATKSSSRQVKIAACEALHSLVLFMIGRGSQVPDGSLKDKFSMEALYKKIFPALLELACDVEQVTKELFRPLVLQIIHWFTNPKVVQTPESAVILLCLWDGVTDQENTALRDFSAVCLKEFFSWALKQSSKAENGHAENLLRKLNSFALHSNPFKRMGAALTFNSIYTIFRSDDNLIGKYTLHLLILFVDSLAMAHSDDRSLGTQTQCVTALNHIERIIAVKHKHLLKTEKTRKKPACLEEATLDCAVYWLLLQCGCTQTECRHKCMDLVVKLCPLIPSMLISSNLFEKALGTAVTYCGDKDVMSHKALFQWLEALLTSLECYHWAFSEHVLLQKSITSESFADLFSSVRIFHEVEYFIKNVLKDPLSAVISHKGLNQEFTPNEVLKYNRLKCTVFVRLMSFITVVFDAKIYWFWEKLKQLWNQYLWEGIMLCIIDPSSIGFDMSDAEIITNLPLETRMFIQKCLSKSPEFQAYCCTFLHQKLEYNLAKKFPISLKNNPDPIKMLHLLNGYEQLIKAGINELANNLLETVWNESIMMDGGSCKKVALSPAAFQLADKMLCVAFGLGVKTDELADKFISPTTGSGADSKKSGVLIFGIYSASICSYAAKHSSPFVAFLVNKLSPRSFSEISILLKFIDYVACTKTLRRECGKSVLESFLVGWPKITNWWLAHEEADSRYSILSIMSKMLIIDSQVATNVSGKYSTSLYSTYEQLLRKEDLPMDFLVRALDILPFFLDSSKEDTLRPCLEQMIATNFPVESKELSKGTTAYHSYISALKRMLSALHLTGCDYLLKILTVLFCKEESHIVGPSFLSAINRMIKNTVLQTVSISAFITFFCSHITDIMSCLKAPDTMDLIEKGISLAKKICCFKLIELLYLRLTKDLLHTKESQIVEIYLGRTPGSGNELSTDITKLARAFRTTSYELEGTHKDLYRKLNCASFSALIAVVCCTQNDIKFYNGFIFKENPVKNEKIWQRIVDIEQSLSFDVELDTPLARQKKIVFLRHTARRVVESDKDFSEEDFPSSLKLLGSENLALSSLAEDASKFVFSTEDQSDYDRDFVELENDELNKHECMVSFTCLFKHMKDQGLILEGHSNEAAPVWINALIQSLEDIRANNNVRLFLGRLIVNNANILQPYAKHLLKPLMNLIVSGIAGTNLNYYILDILIALLSWAPTAVPQDNISYEASEILSFVIKNCEHQRKEIFRNNLEIIKSIVECWKEVLDVPYHLVYEKMNDPDPESKRNVFGIQLLGVFMSCGLPPYNAEDESRSQSYINILLKNLMHKSKEVYGASAEVVAIILKHLSAQETLDEKHPFFIKTVKQLETVRKQEESKFLYSLNKIHIGCPSIADGFISRLLFLYPSVYGVYKNYILEILYSRVCEIDNGYIALKSLGLFENLESRSEPTQFLALQALEKLIPVLSCDDILSILPGIVDIHAQPSARSRFALFKTLFVLYDKFSHNEGAKEKEITRHAQETLLIGLADPDPTIRLTVDNFWSDEKRLPLGTKERLLALMKNMYSPVTEESFLQYATFLLLERTSHSPDYKRTIFEHPLSDCNFQAYAIQTSWRKRHVAMSPLFTETVSSSLNAIMMSLDEFSKSFGHNEGPVKATQRNNDFSETIDPDIRRSNTYNWLTESSFETSLVAGSFDDTSYNTYASSLSKPQLIALGNENKLLDKKQSSYTSPVKNEKPRKSSVWMLRRRFVKDQKQSDTFAKQELRRQDARKERLKEQRNQRDAQVTMYRQYRIGELPDIQISNAEIIAPIQALAMHDAIIAKLLLKSLLVSVSEFVSKEIPEEYEILMEEISECFGKMLGSSYLYSPSVISFCLESLNQLSDTSFDAESVFVASIGSSQQSTGILLLESKILRGFDSEPSQKKMRKEKQSMSDETSHWMKLAELYRSIDDFDVVNGIFSLTLGHRPENRKALQHECSGQYFQAVELYNKLYDEASDESDQAEKDFWDKAVLSCLDKLTKWENLESMVISRFTSAEAPDLQRIWEDQYIKDNYLPYLIRAKMKQLLRGKKDQSLLSFFDESRTDEEKKRHLESHYAEDLALLYIVQDKFDIARTYSSSCLRRFLKDWQSLSPLAIGMQISTLQKLIAYVELDEFLQVMKQDNFTEAASLTNLLRIWQNRYPASTDSVNIWDDVSTNRHLYTLKFEGKQKGKMAGVEGRKPRFSSSQDILSSSENDGSTELDFKKLSLETSVLIKLGFAKNCAAQGNFPVAISNLKEIYKVSKNLDSSLWSKFIEAYCAINNQNSSFFSPDKRLEVLLGTLKQLGKLQMRCGDTVSQKRLHSETLEMIATMFLRGDILYGSGEEHRKKIIEICGTDCSPSKIPNMLLNKSFLCLKEIIHMDETTKEKGNENLKNIGFAHLELANFCNRYLRKEESDQDFSSIDFDAFEEFPKILTECLLKSMACQIPDALELFPRLLQIIEMHPECIDLFQCKTSEMPCWLFLGWINQMVALLDKPEAVALHQIIENIALTYPNALVYAFHLSSTCYNFSKSIEGQRNEKFVKKIDSILKRDSLTYDFIAALEHLSIPHILFKDFISDYVRLLNIKASKEAVFSLFSTTVKSLFILEDNGRIPVGPLQKEFAEDYKEKFLKICGKKGEKLCKPADQKTISEELRNLYKEASSKAKKHINLKLYSTWLSEFQSWKYSSEIEIPGQYSGKSKPLLDYHVKISGFDEKVLVLSSITVPRRIIIRGNDEKEYKFLVKTGEDLRQDARIEQLFTIMNEIYGKNISCAQRRLSLHTYKVVPLTTRLGLIEWVDHTIVLNDFLMDGMSEPERTNYEKRKSNAIDTIFKLGKGNSNSDIGTVYAYLYQNRSREECVQKYEEIKKIMPKNLLRKSFLKLSSCPEAFVTLRAKFAQSHAVVCLSHWILGIGDRHLGNFLIDKTSGNEIGIDFGHAFGSATQFLGTPELVPFRLTSQYLQLMEPLGVKGIYEATMVHILSALREKSDLILNVMDIFIKEPTLDWKVHAQRQQSILGTQLEGEDDWFPKQRVNIARKKLEGVNPCHITREELKLGHMSKKYFKKMESVCLGTSDFNIRAKTKHTGLTVEEQVDCLLDQATDPHLLCLTYFGWSPWM